MTDGKQTPPVEFWFKPGDDPRREQTQFTEGNLAALKHGINSNVEHLPEFFRIKIESSLTVEQMAFHLGLLIDAAQTIHEELSLSSSVETIEFIGPYQQLISRLIALRSELEGGNLRRGNFGNLTPDKAERDEREYARLLGNSLTKLKRAYMWAQDNGVETASEHPMPRRYLIKGLAGTLAGAANTIERWAKLKQWQEKARQQESNEYIQLLRARRKDSLRSP